MLRTLIWPLAFAAKFARCFLRLANLPNFALDRLSRYEATLWRQAGRILLLDALDRRKPQERRRNCYVSSRQNLADFERE
jgi:hypothetical protein